MRSSSSVGIFFDTERISLLSIKSTLRGPVTEDVLDIEPDREDAGERLERFLRARDRQKVFVAIPRSKTVMVHLDLPSPTEENLREVLAYELDGCTPYSADRAYFDFQVIDRDREKNTIRVLLVVVPKKELDERLDMLARAGIRPVTVEISSTAVVNALVYGEEGAERGLCGVVLAGRGSGEVILIKDGALCYSRAFSYAPEALCDVVREEVDRALHSTGFKAEDFARLFIASDDGPGDSEIVEELDARFPGTAVRAFSGPGGHHGRSVEGAHTVSFGLALRTHLDEPAPIDLMPRLQRARKKRNPLHTIVPLVVTVIVLAAGVLVTPLLKGTALLEEMDGRIKALEPQVREVERIKGDIKVLEKRLESLESLGEESIKVLDMLRELTVLLPDDTFLNSFKFSPGKVEIGGYSTSASSLIPLLENSPLFANVEFSAPVTTRDRTKGRGRVFLGASLPVLSGEEEGDSDRGLEQFRIRAVPEEVM